MKQRRMKPKKYKGRNTKRYKGMAYEKGRETKESITHSQICGLDTQSYVICNNYSINIYCMYSNQNGFNQQALARTVNHMAFDNVRLSVLGSASGWTCDDPSLILRAVRLCGDLVSGPFLLGSLGQLLRTIDGCSHCSHCFIWLWGELLTT